MLKAAPGTRFLDADLSNIEGRVNAWNAGEQWKLDAFRLADWGLSYGLYEITAAGIIGCGLDQVSKAQRQAQGKIPELACIGPDTLVLTDTGCRRIKDVTTQHRVWDGREWVKHGGLADRGRRAVIALNGVLMTNDHLILSATGKWSTAEQVASDRDLNDRASALASASLPLSPWSKDRSAALEPSPYNVAAAPRRTTFTSATFAEAQRKAARRAPRNMRAALARCIGVTPTSLLTMSIDAVYSTASRHVLIGATTRAMPPTLTTAAGAFMSSSRGEKIDARSSRTWPACPVGISRRSIWTGRTSTKATRRATSASPPARPIKGTGARFRSCKLASPNWSDVYDLVDAGPRNRFTIRTDNGWFVVHNCGYQGSVGAFVSMAATYQTKPEDVADIAAQTVAPDVWAKTLNRWRPNTSAGLEPHVWTGIKCVVDGWRAKHPAIVKSWYDLQDAAIMAVSQPGTVIPCCKVRYLCSKGFLWCQLPSGRVMAYPQPRIIRQKTERLTPIADPAMTVLDEDDELVQIGELWYIQKTVWSNVVEVWGLEKGQWRPYTLYGGLQCENVCQGIARDVLACAMLRIEAAGYPIVLHAHDNVLCECRVGFGSRQELKDLLSQGEPWTAGLPLDAKTSEDERYK